MILQALYDFFINIFIIFFVKFQKNSTLVTEFNITKKSYEIHPVLDEFHNSFSILS